MGTQSPRKKLFHTLSALIIFIFLANALANKFYWYSSLWYFDIIMHFLGGFWVGILAFYVFPVKKINKEQVFKLLAIVLLVGGGWEFFEIFVDKAISRNAFNAPDTFSDLFFDAAGGMAAMGYYLRSIMRTEEDKVQ